MALRRHWWLALMSSVLLVYALASLSLPRGQALISLADLTSLLLMLLAAGLLAANAVSSHGQTRTFWGLLTAGCLMWATGQGLWAYYEVILRRDLPEPFVGDVILFVHIVPIMAAVALRPHRPQEKQKVYFSTLNFLMLLVWWIFLYMFIVFPDEYVVLNVAVYSRNYDFLYLMENLVLLGAFGVLAASARGAWRVVYWNLFVATGIYTLTSESMNAAIARGQYYSGSIYDIPFVASICWLIYTALLARENRPSFEPALERNSRWLSMAPRLAMLAILSLPVMGFWTMFFDPAAPRLRTFRLLVTLAAMLVMGLFVFLRQYLLDRELVRLLDDSHGSLENLQRLQTQLVQKEKLASLGQLVAGAAHEINNPLAAILGYSELLATNDGLDSKQVTMAHKIAQQARRTRDLVSGLLSFAQQAPAKMTLVEIGSLLHRVVHVEKIRLEKSGARLDTGIASDLPHIWGNSNQLFQCCREIVGNSIDALEEVRGGVLFISAHLEGTEIVVEFSDSGPGIREPQRVFDPFYTTKPIGKGTGLGLSATYGVVQDHHGQITCHNRPQGGASFVLRFPVATEDAPLEAQAAKA